MSDYNFINTTCALIEEWVSKYDDGIISAFLKTIEHKKCEVLLFEEIFINHNDFELSFELVNKKLGVLKNNFELEIEFHYLLLDWSKYIKGDSL